MTYGYFISSLSCAIVNTLKLAKGLKKGSMGVDAANSTIRRKVF